MFCHWTLIIFAIYELSIFQLHATENDNMNIYEIVLAEKNSI